MKLKIFSLLIAVLMSTAVLTSCSKAPAGAESGAQSESSAESSDEKYGFVPCTYEETLAFIETDEAQKQAESFCRWDNLCEFSSAGDTDITDIFLIQFGHDMYLELGESAVTEDGFFIAIPKELADRYLYKYFGIVDFDPNRSQYYSAETNCYNLPEATDGAKYFTNSVEAVSVSGNTVVYKCVFNAGIYGDSPTRYYASLMTMQALKDGDETFLRLLSNQNRTDCFYSAEEAAAIELNDSFPAYGMAPDFTESFAKASFMGYFAPMIVTLSDYGDFDSQNISAKEAFACFEAFLSESRHKIANYDEITIKYDEYLQYYPGEIVENFALKCFGIPAESMRELSVFNGEIEAYERLCYGGIAKGKAEISAVRLNEPECELDFSCSGFLHSAETISGTATMKYGEGGFVLSGIRFD